MSFNKEKDEVLFRQKSRNIRNTIVGLVVTVAFVAADVFMLYAMFIGGDIPQNLSYTNSVIGALILDVIPYFLGIVIARSSDAAIEERHKKNLKTAKIPLGFAMVLIFVVYIAIRVIIFIGGSDFNTGWQMILGMIPWESSSETVNAADAITGLLPLVTSIVALTVGLLLYETKEKAVIHMRNMYKDMLNSAQKNVESQKAIFTSEAMAAWEYYGTGDFPKEVNIHIIGDLYKGYRRANNTLYSELYKIFVENIYNTANAEMEDATLTLSDYAGDSSLVREMSKDAYEEKILADLKKVDESVKKEIEKRVIEKNGLDKSKSDTTDSAKIFPFAVS